jgi:hypothetical protein
MYELTLLQKLDKNLKSVEYENEVKGYLDLTREIHSD